MKRSLKFLIATSIALLAFPAMASNFRAADIVYLNAVGRVVGANAFFKTDVVVTNVSNAAVEVDVVLLATGGGDARAGLDNPAPLGTLQPGESLFIEDIVQSVFNSNSAFGHAIFYACRVGGDCSDCDNDDTDCLNIVVEGRIYDEKTSPAICGTRPACGFGQLFSGYPWYSYVSSTVANRDLDEVWITGIRQNDQFRSNLGFANASEFSTTVLTVFLHNDEGQQVQQTSVTLGPLGHRQLNVSQLFPGFSGFGYVRVVQTPGGVTPTNPDTPGLEDGLPGFYAYGSVLDNSTNDPTTLEAVYTVPFDFETVYGKLGTSATRRPVSHPDSK